MTRPPDRSGRSVALDSNLLVLWIAGSRFPDMVGRHKRLKAYASDDLDILRRYLQGVRIVTTPNAMTEVSNLIVYGVKEPQRSALLGALGAFCVEVEERYVATETAAALPAFTRLGVADAAWLDCVGEGVDLLTDDLALYLAAANRGLSATNFNHLRDA
jgi:hypothetical protein